MNSGTGPKNLPKLLAEIEQKMNSTRESASSKRRSERWNDEGSTMTSERGTNVSHSNVYQAINAVQAAMAKEGISKGRKNVQQGYAFRGIDDVYNAISTLLAANGLTIIPMVESREVEERETKNGGALFYVTVKVSYRLTLSADPTSFATAVVYGEAMDSGDKATNKALSAAYKYLCLQTFCIPTEGDNDADAHTHDVRPTSVRAMVLENAKIDEEALSEPQAAIREALKLFTEDPTEARILVQDAVRGLDGDHKVALFNLFDSKERARIKELMK